METYITIGKINSQREFAVWLKKLKQGLCINLEGWDGEGDGRGYMYTYADDTTLMAESEEELKPLDESERGE